MTQILKDAGTTALSDIGSQSAGTYFSPNPFNIMILRNLRKFRNTMSCEAFEGFMYAWV